jgi:hypothetical protein
MPPGSRRHNDADPNRRPHGPPRSAATLPGYLSRGADASGMPQGEAPSRATSLSAIRAEPPVPPIALPTRQKAARRAPNGQSGSDAGENCGTRTSKYPQTMMGDGTRPLPGAPLSRRCASQRRRRPPWTRAAWNRCPTTCSSMVRGPVQPSSSDGRGARPTCSGPYGHECATRHWRAPVLVSSWCRAGRPGTRGFRFGPEV